MYTESDLKRKELHVFEKLKDETLYESVLNSYLDKKKRKSRYKDAFFYMNKAYSYKELIYRINYFTESLKRIGVKKDTVVTLCLPNIPCCFYLLYSINQIGAIANIIHPLMAKETILETMDMVGSNILFILDTRYNDFTKEEKEKYNIYSSSPTLTTNLLIKLIYKIKNKDKLKVNKGEIIKNLNSFYKKKEVSIDLYDKDFKKDSVYLHSGGTMGIPKTIALSNSSINYTVGACYDYLRINEDEKCYVLTVLPMFHGFGLTIGAHFALATGLTDMLMPKFSATTTIKYLKKNRLSFIVGVPVLFEKLLRKKKFNGKCLRNLKSCFAGGDFVSEPLINDFNKRISDNGGECRLFVGYGLTETVTVCMLNSHYGEKLDTVGRPLRLIKTLIIDENDNVLPNNTEGELVITGPTLMNGYRFSSEKENEKVYITIDNEKYIRTGDYGFIDEDNYFHFRQRIKRLIKVSGINIFPSEIENACLKLPFVYEACAIGVKDDVHQEMVKLFIVLDKKNKLPLEVVKEKINEEVVKKCSIYAKPKEIVFIDELPKTLIGKIDTKKLS